MLLENGVSGTDADCSGMSAGDVLNGREDADAIFAAAREHSLGAIASLRREPEPDAVAQPVAETAAAADGGADGGANTMYDLRDVRGLGVGKTGLPGWDGVSTPGWGMLSGK